MRGPRGRGVSAPRPGRDVLMSGATSARAFSVNSLTLSADVSSERSAGRVGAAVVLVVPTTAQTDVLRQQVLAANQAANARQSVGNAIYEAFKPQWWLCSAFVTVADSEQFDAIIAASCLLQQAC